MRPAPCCRRQGVQQCTSLPGHYFRLDFRDLQASVDDDNMRCEQIDPVSAVLQPSCFSLHKHTFTSSSFVAAHPFLLQINQTFLFCSCAVYNIARLGFTCVNFCLDCY